MKKGAQWHCPPSPMATTSTRHDKVFYRPRAAAYAAQVAPAPVRKLRTKRASFIAQTSIEEERVSLELPSAIPFQPLPTLRSLHDSLLKACFTTAWDAFPSLCIALSGDGCWACLTRSRRSSKRTRTNSPRRRKRSYSRSPGGQIKSSGAFLISVKEASHA